MHNRPKGHLLWLHMLSFKRKECGVKIKVYFDLEQPVVIY